MTPALMTCVEMRDLPLASLVSTQNKDDDDDGSKEEEEEGSEDAESLDTLFLHSSETSFSLSLFCVVIASADVDVNCCAGVSTFSSSFEEDDETEEETDDDEVNEILLERFMRVFFEDVVASVVTSSALETSTSFDDVVVPIVVEEETCEEDEGDDDDDATSFGFVINFFNSFSQEAFLAISLMSDFAGYP